MKSFLTIIAIVLFCSVFFTPADDAPLGIFILWSAWCCLALYIVNRIIKMADKESEKN